MTHPNKDNQDERALIIDGLCNSPASSGRRCIKPRDHRGACELGPAGAAANSAPPALDAEGLPALPAGDEYSATRMLSNGELAPRFNTASMRRYALRAVAADRLARQDQQPARASVDTEEFRAILDAIDMESRTNYDRVIAALIAHINAWGGVAPK